jgi:hypothetical protein
VTRYVGTGAGSWRGIWYRYVPSTGDLATARAFGEAVPVRRQRNRQSGYGSQPEPARMAAWEATGFLGEVAALYPFDAGPEVGVYEGRGWAGRADYGILEVRTASTRQLYGFARWPDRHDPGLAGWRVKAKDRGRIIVCVERRDVDLVVHGYAYADDVVRLPAPLGGILAVIEPPELRPFAELLP